MADETIRRPARPPDAGGDGRGRPDEGRHTPSCAALAAALKTLEPRIGREDPPPDLLDLARRVGGGDGG